MASINCDAGLCSSPSSVAFFACPSDCFDPAAAALALAWAAFIAALAWVAMLAMNG